MPIWPAFRCRKRRRRTAAKGGSERRRALGDVVEDRASSFRTPCAGMMARRRAPICAAAALPPRRSPLPAGLCAGADGLRAALAARGFSDADMLVEGGLANLTAMASCLTIFRDRVMFPITDRTRAGDRLWRAGAWRRPAKISEFAEGPTFPQNDPLWSGAGA